MPLNKKLNLLFIHNPKCAGSMMEKYFDMGRGQMNLMGMKHVTRKDIKIRDRKNFTQYTIPLQHLTPQSIIDDKILTEEKFKSHFSFVFVRNPWDKVISSYVSYFKKLYPDFDEFLNWLIEISFVENGDERYIYKDRTSRTINTHFTEQHKFLNYNEKQIVNFVGRYEDLENDLKKVCDLINVKFKPLPIINKTENKEHYSTYYNDKQAEIVGMIYRKDVELFNYKFEKI